MVSCSARLISMTRICGLLAALLAGPALTAMGQDTPGSIADRVAFDQKLGDQIPLDATFRDESGRIVRLGEYFSRKPVILTLVYYNCPLLCTQVLNSLTRAIRPLSGGVGKDFDILTVSIDPDETSALASSKKEAYLRRYERPGPEAEAGWHFLTGDKPQIESLANSVGFRYSYNPRTKLYAHAAGIVILSPTGRVTRYFYGLDYPSKDLQYMLREAAAEKVASPISRVLLLCYDYDAATGKYTLSILRLLRVAGVATVVSVAAFMAIMFRRDHRARISKGLGDRVAGSADFSAH